jgi:hypothetical protein
MPEAASERDRFTIPRMSDELATAPAGTIEAPRPAAGSDLRWWATSVVAGAVAFVVIAVPTALVATPLFGREIAPRWWDYVVLAASSLLMGMLWASRAPSGAEALPDEPARRRTVVGGVLTFLAVGCPVCNKLVLLALGTSGALTWFAPLQPILGLTAVALLAVTLRRVLRDGRAACAT